MYLRGRSTIAGFFITRCYRSPQRPRCLSRWFEVLLKNWAGPEEECFWEYWYPPQSNDCFWPSTYARLGFTFLLRSCLRFCWGCLRTWKWTVLRRTQPLSWLRGCWGERSGCRSWFAGWKLRIPWWHHPQALRSLRWGRSYYRGSRWNEKSALGSYWLRSPNYCDRSCICRSLGTAHLLNHYRTTLGSSSQVDISIGDRNALEVARQFFLCLKLNGLPGRPFALLDSQ